MMKTQQEKLKLKIVKIIKRSGLPVRTQYLTERVRLPEHVVMNDLLTEMVAEKRLSRSYTLLSNGDPDCTYDVIV
ncbi:MAG: hypothetical protein EHM39_09275 [Chloroflexi bacterium]|nr:MAG: hypothetical protein EHM39_09275 [Chloroflexota bacterium]